jgi:methionyl-tRNA formyltransferase
MPLRLIFMGTPDFAVPTLTAIADAGHTIAAVYTRAPKPAGRRGLELTPTPVERVARRLDVPVLTPATLRSEPALAEFRAHEADVAVVVAYGLLLPKLVLDAVPRGCFNLHASLLPRWRGAAPIARAVMAGDAETGVMVMRMEEGLDTGPVAFTDRVPITADATAGDLHDLLAVRGAALMVDALGALEAGALATVSQPAEGVTYASKIDKGETRIDWHRPWQEVHNHIRGLSPFPGAWCEISEGGKPVRIKVLRCTRGAGAGAPGSVLDDRLTVACGTGAIRLVELQRAGRHAMSAEEFLRGTKLAGNAQLS